MATPPATDQPAAQLTPEQVYDMFMEKIEPELVTNNLDKLDEKYKNETPEQAKLRAERYDKAFEEYQHRLAKSLQEAETTYMKQQKNAKVSAEKQADTAKLSSIESSIDEA